MTKQLACFFLLLFAIVTELWSQPYIIEGKITDKETGKPVPGASVFLSSTSIGTAADDKGGFILHNVPHGKFDLVVSSLGYQTYAISVTPEKLNAPLVILLTAKANELKEVVVGGFEKDGWQKWGKIFTDDFIGTSYLAYGCTIKNRDVIKFRYSKKRDFLQAFAEEPLVIENSALGYIIHYKLEGFALDFANRSITYKGFPLFEEMRGNARKQRKWNERRKDVYYGSIMHFMRCVFTNKVVENGYEIKRLEKITNTEKKRIQALYKYYITPDISETDFESRLPKDSLTYYQKILAQKDETDILHNEVLRGDSIAYGYDSVTAVLQFRDYLYITYKNKEEPDEYLLQTNQKGSLTGKITSQASLINGRPIYVLYNGAYFQPDDLLTLGYWGWSEKISSLLPYDYWP